MIARCPSPNARTSSVFLAVKNQIGPPSSSSSCAVIGRLWPSSTSVNPSITVMSDRSAFQNFSSISVSFAMAEILVSFLSNGTPAFLFRVGTRMLMNERLPAWLERRRDLLPDRSLPLARIATARLAALAAARAGRRVLSLLRLTSAVAARTDAFDTLALIFLDLIHGKTPGFEVQL